MYARCNVIVILWYGANAKEMFKIPISMVSPHNTNVHKSQSQTSSCTQPLSLLSPKSQYLEVSAVSGDVNHGVKHS